jgi:DNA modification methylase
MKEPIIGQKRPSGTTDLKGSFQTNSDWVIFAHKGRFKFRKTKLLRNKRAGTIPNKGRKPVPEWKQRFPSAWFGADFPYSSENPQFQKKLKTIGAKLRHPTIKGRKFCEWLVQLTTDPGGLVVDPFAGSGTIPVAASSLGRSVIAGDAKAEFAELARLRIAKNV